MANVYSWPPVAVIAKMWNLDQPVSRSYSMVSGRRFASASLPPRRRAKISVQGRRNYGLGYLAALERFLQGGLHLVRLTSCRMAFGEVGDFGVYGRQGSYFDWRETGNASTEFGWRTQDSGDSFLWFEGFSAWASTVVGLGGRVIQVAGTLPPLGSIVALPGEFVTVFTSLNPQGETHMVANVVKVQTGETGNVANFRLVTPVSGPGRINLNTSETGVFELNSPFPDLGRVGADVPDFTLDFREILEGEVSEGLTELNPWT